MPLQRRLPKRGFTNIFKKKYAIVNIRDLRRFEKGTLVDEAALVEAGKIYMASNGLFPSFLYTWVTTTSAITPEMSTSTDVDFRGS